MTDAAWRFVPFDAYRPSPPPASGFPEDWAEGAEAFRQTLSDDGAPCDGLPRVAIGLFGRAGRLLRAWAAGTGAVILEPPTAEALLTGNAVLLPEQEGGVYVVPALERCFLRHYRGIRPARRLVESVWGRPCRLVIGCDAWSWRYLRRAVQIDALCSNPLTAAPLMAPPAAIAADVPGFAPRAEDGRRIEAYVLHALLAHDGAEPAILPHLLPFRATQIGKALADLRARRLVCEEAGRQRVAPEYYAAVRAGLKAAEFPTDE
jgi:hypothetical protein